MNTKMKIAFACYFSAGLLLAAFGVVYLFRAEFMPYHSVAVGMPWADVPPNFKILIVALMRAVGGANIALATAMFILLIVPFRAGARWALWTVPLLGLLQCAGGLYAMSHVALNTTANPPVWAVAIGMLLTVIGFLVSLSARNSEKV